MGLYDDKKNVPADGAEVQVQESKTFDDHKLGDFHHHIFLLWFPTSH